MMRTFVGIFPPPEVREAALAQARGLSFSGNVRWTKPSNIHLTLTFLGEVPEDLLPRAREAVREVCELYEPFSVRLSGFGGFPSEKCARVLWAGISEGTAELVSFYGDLGDALASTTRLPRDRGREGRDYIPHLTLGRCARRPVTLEAAGNTPEIPGFLVREVSLVKSELSKAGAVYSILGSYPLIGRSRPESYRE